MPSPASGAKGLLESQDIHTGCPIFVGQLVPEPDFTIGIFDTPGQNPNPKWLIDYPCIQCLIRGPKDEYDTAWDKAKDVKDVLLGLEPQNVGSDRWSGVLGMGDIAWLKFDENRRPIFSVNFRILLEPATSALTNREPL